MTNLAPRFSIILAAGEGRRMQSADVHKVCFPVGGEPAINRAIRTYKECGVTSHIVVVGSRAEQIMRVVKETHAGVFFAFQFKPLGTADAARAGIELVEALQEDADILVTAGDKVIEPSVLRDLFALYYSQKCDLAFVTGPREHSLGSGRLVRAPSGSIAAIVEAADVVQRSLLRQIRTATLRGAVPTPSTIRELIVTRFDPARAERAFGDLLSALASHGERGGAADILDLVPEEVTRFSFTPAETSPFTLTPEDVEAMPQVNQSVYVLRASWLRRALGMLGRENAQKEEYLSDLITVLAGVRAPDGRALRIEALHVSEPGAVAGFNNPEELLAIEDYLRRKAQKQARRRASPPGTHTVDEWIARMKPIAEGGGRSSPCEGMLREFYGDNEEVLRERARAYVHLLQHAVVVLGPSAGVLLVRSPGRVNLLGRHVDHQGGNCNLMTIGRETLMAVHPRDDDVIELHNTDPERFPRRRFSIGELVAALPWDDWMSLVSSDAVRTMVKEAAGDWAQYARAAVLRLQKRFPGTRLRGADVVVTGNIPMAAGLSSSSALVVGMAEAISALNDLDLVPGQLVDLCGEGEWFVGTRGGSADHAAIKLGQKGKVVKVTFFDFGVDDLLPFPEDYVLAVCNSGIKAQKTTNARDQFNHRVACYRIGLLLIRSLFPQYAPLLRHLRDVNTRTLGVPLSAIYRILLRLPEVASRAQLRDLLPGQDLAPFFATHAEPSDGAYPVRGVVLYGLAECERSRSFASHLKESRLGDVGRLMRVSHDGDRVACLRPDGTMSAYAGPTSNTYLLDLIEDLVSENPERVQRAQLSWQPGAYACSIPEIDCMVDIANATPGVVGAQLAGAGLGGCMMVLLRRDASHALRDNLEKGYYAQRGAHPDVLFCEPVAGSGVLRDGP